MGQTNSKRLVMFASHIKQTIFFSKFILLASKFSKVWTFPRKSMGKKLRKISCLVVLKKFLKKNKI